MKGRWKGRFTLADSWYSLPPGLTDAEVVALKMLEHWADDDGRFEYIPELPNILDNWQGRYAGRWSELLKSLVKKKALEVYQAEGLTVARYVYWPHRPQHRKPSAFPPPPSESELRMPATTTPETGEVPLQAIVRSWNNHFPEGQGVPGFSPLRLKDANDKTLAGIRHAWEVRPSCRSEEWWEGLFSRIAASDFLCGRVASTKYKHPFRISLEWMLAINSNGRQEWLEKIIEGRYDNNITHIKRAEANEAGRVKAQMREVENQTRESDRRINAMPGIERNLLREQAIAKIKADMGSIANSFMSETSVRSMMRALLAAGEQDE